jgi:hypothetical protein
VQRLVQSIARFVDQILAPARIKACLIAAFVMKQVKISLQETLQVLWKQHYASNKCSQDGTLLACGGASSQHAKHAKRRKRKSIGVTAFHNRKRVAMGGN